MIKVKEMILFAITNFWTIIKTKVVLKENVVNNLSSDSENEPLSANQGKVLKGSIDVLNANIDNVKRDLGYVTILPQGTYKVNTEYTPTSDPRKCRLFSGFMSWNDFPVTEIQWKDNDNWHVRLNAVKSSENYFRCLETDMVINNATGKVKFERFTDIYVDSTGFRSANSTECTGVMIHGRIF